MWKRRFDRTPVSSSMTSSGWTSASPFTGAIEIRLTVGTQTLYAAARPLEGPYRCQAPVRNCHESVKPVAGHADRTIWCGIVEACHGPRGTHIPSPSFTLVGAATI